MARKKAGCLNATLGCLGFIVLGGFGISVFIGLISDQNNAERQQLDVAKPRGTFERLKHDLGDKYDASSRGGSIFLTINSSTGFSSGGTLAAIQRDITKGLQVIHESGIDYDTVEVSAVTGLIDQFGNTHKDTTVYASYERYIVDQINFKNFGPWNVLEITERKRIHPALTE